MEMANINQFITIGHRWINTHLVVLFFIIVFCVYSYIFGLADNLFKVIFLYLLSFPYVCIIYPISQVKPSLLEASLNVKILTFTFLQFQSLPPVVKYVVPALCVPSCHFLFSVWNETSPCPQSSLAAVLEDNEIGCRSSSGSDSLLTDEMQYS